MACLLCRSTFCDKPSNKSCCRRFLDEVDDLFFYKMGTTSAVSIVAQQLSQRSRGIIPMGQKTAICIVNLNF